MMEFSQTGVIDLYVEPTSVPPELKKEGSDWFAVYSPAALKDASGKRRLDVNLLHTLMHESVVCCVRFSADGKYLATGCNRTAQIYNTKTGKKTCVLVDEGASKIGDIYIRSVCFSPDGKYLATGAEDKQIRIWDIAKRTIRRTFEGHQQEIYSLEFSRNGNLIVSGSGDKTVRIWDMVDGNIHKILAINDPDSIDAGVTSVCISPDGRLVAAGSLDAVVRIWDVQTGNLIDRLRAHRDSVYSLAFTPDGCGLVSGSLDMTLLYWDLKPIMRRAGAGADAPASAPGSANGAGKKEVKRQHTMNFLGHKDYVLSVAVSHDGQWVVSGSKDRGVQFWDAKTAQAQCMLRGHISSVISVDVSPAGSILATGSGDWQARIWSYSPNFDAGPPTTPSMHFASGPDSNVGPGGSANGGGPPMLPITAEASEGKVTLRDIEASHRNAISSPIPNAVHEEIMQLIQRACQSADHKATLLAIRGEMLPHVLIAMQEILDRWQSDSGHLASKERHTIRRLLTRLSKESDTLPTSLFLSEVRCENRESLNGGSFADIYRALWREQPIALKRLRVFHRAKFDHWKAICQEALVWRQLRHCHILPLLGVDRQTFNSSLCLVSPWMEHGNVYDCIGELRDKGERIPVNAWLLQAAQGLHYLHEEHIVHGDLRGANVLIDDNLRVRLGDFGLAFFAETSTASLGTHPGGAMRWMAPELVTSRIPRPNYACDVYAFACVCLEIYTCRPPFVNIAQDAQVILQVDKGIRPARPVETVGVAMSDELWELIESCWHGLSTERPGVDAVVRRLKGMDLLGK